MSEPPSLIRRLWREFVARHGGDLAALAPALVLVAAAGTAYGFILKIAIDRLNAGDARVALWAPAAVILVTGLRAFAIWAQAVLSQTLSLKVLRDLQRAMFAKLMRADYARLAREETGRFVSRFTNDINVVSDGLVRAVQAARYAKRLGLNQVTLAVFVPVEDEAVLQALSVTETVDDVVVTVVAIGWV